MSIEQSSAHDRLLPTYRWSQKDQRVSGTEKDLGRLTSLRLINFLHEFGEDETLPPEGVILPIVGMNVHKRTAAVQRAQELIVAGEVSAPPPSLIPTFMASGHEIAGIEDGYMTHDHPSQELFAYNRLGKKSWLNRQFGEHCLRAIGFAHPHGDVQAATSPTRAKAHSPMIGLTDVDSNGLDEWAVISTKTPIATIHENGRQASLVSRVTGAVDLTSSELADQELHAITWLSQHEMLPEHASDVALGNKALLLDAIERHDGSSKNPFYPVIQTIYVTQQPLK